MGGTGNDSAASRAAGRPDRAPPPDPAVAEQAIRALRAAGTLADAAQLANSSARTASPTPTTPCCRWGAAVLEAYADQLTRADPRAADAVYRRAAGEQRSFAAAATSGGEGIARMADADRIDAKRRA
jgi:hypothetical protein